MWRKIYPLLIILSVTLNVAFAAAWGIASFQRARPAHCAMKHHDGTIWCPLHRSLGLNEDQWREIEPRMAAFQDSTRVLCEHIRSVRASLIDLLESGEPDPDAIRAVQRRIAVGQQQMQGLVIDHLLAEKELLSGEQWKTMIGLLRGQKGCGAHGPMGPFRTAGCADSVN